MSTPGGSAFGLDPFRAGRAPTSAARHRSGFPQQPAPRSTVFRPGQKGQPRHRAVRLGRRPILKWRLSGVVTIPERRGLPQRFRCDGPESYIVSGQRGHLQRRAWPVRRIVFLGRLPGTVHKRRPGKAALSCPGGFQGVIRRPGEQGTICPWRQFGVSPRRQPPSRGANRLRRIQPNRSVPACGRAPTVLSGGVMENRVGRHRPQIPTSRAGGVEINLPTARHGEQHDRSCPAGTIELQGADGHPPRPTAFAAGRNDL